MPGSSGSSGRPFCGSSGASSGGQLVHCLVPRLEVHLLEARQLEARAPLGFQRRGVLALLESHLVAPLLEAGLFHASLSAQEEALRPAVHLQRVARMKSSSVSEGLRRGLPSSQYEIKILEQTSVTRLLLRHFDFSTGLYLV